MLDYVTDKPHFVVVTWPDGTVEVFDLIPTQSLSIFPYLSTAEFKGRTGTTSTLQVLDNSLHFTGDGNLYGGPFGSSGIYNPQTYLLTDKYGTEYTIGKESGLLKIRDLSGNETIFASNEIANNFGEKIEIVRDVNNRISEIIDLAGNRISYIQ